MYPMTLRLPLVLDDNRTTDRVEVAMAPGVEVEVTRQRAIERGDGDCILDQGAGIGCAQFERGVVQLGADGPPNVA